MSMVWWALISFTIFSFVNVILQTVRSIFTIKASNQVAAVTAAVCYSVYTIVLKQMGNVDLVSSVVLTGITNYAGTLFAMWLLNKFKRDTIWIVDVIAGTGAAYFIQSDLGDHAIVYCVTKSENLGSARQEFIRIYSQNQKESIIIKEILAKYRNTAYAVTQTAGKL